MDIKSKLIELVQYYDCTRGVGHTHTMLNGAAHVRCIILSHSERYARELLKHAPEARVIVLQDGQELCGLRLPLVIEHCALRELLEEVLQEIERLETQCVLPVDTHR